MPIDRKSARFEEQALLIENLRQGEFCPVRVEIDEAQLRKYPELALKPGMPAKLFIETGSRAMISYVTKPLRDQFARAFGTIDRRAGLH